MRQPAVTDSNGERGATMVEGSIVLSIFLLSLIVGSDLLRVSYVYLAAQHAVEKTTSVGALTPSAAGKTRADTIRELLLKKISAMGLSAAAENVWVCRAADTEHCQSQDAGDPRTNFRVTLDYPIRIASLNRDITLTFAALGRNERME